VVSWLVASAATGVWGQADEGQCAEEVEAGMKNVRYDATLSRDLCVCKDGWIGPACDVCTSNQACGTPSSTRNSTTCVRTTALASPGGAELGAKTFYCQLDATSPIKSFLGSGDVWGQCDLESETCEVNFGGGSVLRAHVACGGSGCKAEPGTEPGETSINCQSIQCGPAGQLGWPTSIPEFLRNTLEKKFEGGQDASAFKISCATVGSAASPRCTVDLSGQVPIPIELTCSFGDCVTEPSRFSSYDVPGAGFRNTTSAAEEVGTGSNTVLDSGLDDKKAPVSSTSTAEDAPASERASSATDGSALLSQPAQVAEASAADETCSFEKENGIEQVAFDKNAGTCTCEKGWIGPQCQVCTFNEACEVKGGDTCVESVALVDAIDRKSYSCELDATSPLLTFLGGVPNFWGQCDLKNKTCSVDFGGKNTTQPHVQCLASECDFGSKPIVGGGDDNKLQTDFVCQMAQCKQSEKFGWPASLPTFIRGPLSSQNTSITISCKGGTEGGVCTVQVALIPLPIDIKCKFGDCYQKESSAGTSQTELIQNDVPVISGSKNESELPLEMIFLPILLLVLIFLAVGMVLYTQMKKQYYRSLFSKEMMKLTGAKKSMLSRMSSSSDMSPALRASVKYYPENAKSDKYTDLNMNLVSELSFKNIFYDVVANPDDENWMKDGTSVHAKLGNFKQKLGNFGENIKMKVDSSLRDMNSLLTKKKSLSEVLSDKSKSVELEMQQKDQEDAKRETNSLPEFRDDDVVSDLEEIYTPVSTPGVAAESPSRGQIPSEGGSNPDSGGKGHKRWGSSLGSLGADSYGRSTFYSTVAQTARHMQRTASKVREAVKDTFKKTKRRILHGVSGSVQRGNMLAIMGPSGCGKSTLLNILADGNMYGAKVRGSVEIDGQKRRRWYRHITTYIPQSDELIPIMTVKESIMYSGELQLPWYYSKGRRIHKVYEVLETLKIDHIAQQQVGGSCGIRGISGGERRRVSVGMGLIADPKIMILDEPTSGLDSAAAAQIITTLKELAQKGDGRIVIASLHQPSAETFQELDLLLLLAKGRQIYFGPAERVQDKFNRCGFPCPKGLNIADYILHVVSDLSCLRELINVQQELDALAISSSGSGSDDQDQAGLYAPALTSGETLKPSDESFAKSRGTRNRSLDNLWRVEMYKPFTTELRVCLTRSFKQIWRRPLLFRLQVALAIIAALLSMAMFSDMSRTIAGVQNRIGFLFFQLAFFAFAGISSLDLILEERSVFVREIQGKFYTPWAYYLSKVIVDGLMLRVIPMVIYDVMTYWTVGLRPGADHFFIYLIATVLFSLGCGALSVAVTMGSKTGGVASLGIILLLLFSMMFGGFLSARDSIPSWISWIQYLSLFYHVMGALVSNEIRGVTFSTTISGITVKFTGTDVLDQIKFAIAPNITEYIGALTALWFMWLVIGYIAMKIYLFDGTWKSMIWKKKTE